MLAGVGIPQADIQTPAGKRVTVGRIGYLVTLPSISQEQGDFFHRGHVVSPDTITTRDSQLRAIGRKFDILNTSFPHTHDSSSG